MKKKVFALIFALTVVFAAVGTYRTLSPDAWHADIAPRALADVPAKPAEFAYAYDFEGSVLSQSDIAQITRYGEALEDATGIQVVAVIVDFLNGADPADYATDLINTWGIGSKENDDGVVILLARGDREIQIGTGTGLDRVMTGATCGELIDQNIDDFAANRFAQGMCALYADVCEYLAKARGKTLALSGAGSTGLTPKVQSTNPPSSRSTSSSSSYRNYSSTYNSGRYSSRGSSSSFLLFIIIFGIILLPFFLLSSGNSHSSDGNNTHSHHGGNPRGGSSSGFSSGGIWGGGSSGFSSNSSRGRSSSGFSSSSRSSSSGFSSSSSRSKSSGGFSSSSSRSSGSSGFSSSSRSGSSSSSSRSSSPRSFGGGSSRGGGGGRKF